jgi:hypothetical protein
MFCLFLVGLPGITRPGYSMQGLWLRFQFKSEFSNCIPDLIKTLDLPFQRKNESLPDAKNSDMLA